MANNRKHSVGIMAGISPVFVYNDSAVFSLDGWNFFSYNFDYDRETLDKLSELVSLGKCSSIEAYLDHPSSDGARKWDDFCMFCKKYYNVYAKAINDGDGFSHVVGSAKWYNYLHNHLYRLHTVDSEYVYFISTVIPKGNSRINISMIINNENLAHSPYLSEAQYGFSCICNELNAFLSKDEICDLRKFRFTLNPIRIIKERIIGSEPSLPSIFESKKFFWNDPSSTKIINKSKYCAINVNITQRYFWSRARARDWPTYEG